MINFANYKHLSTKANLSLLTPEIPKEILAHKDTTLEDYTIPRICLAPTVSKCLLGIQLNDSDFVDDKDKLFYIYKPINFKYQDIISNNYIVKHRLVFDAHITKEVWYTEPLEVQLIGVCTCTSFSKSAPVEILYTPIINKNKQKLVDTLDDYKFLRHNKQLSTFLPKFTCDYN